MNSLNNPIETPAVDPIDTIMVESDPNVNNTNFSAALALKVLRLPLGCITSSNDGIITLNKGSNVHANVPNDFDNDIKIVEQSLSEIKTHIDGSNHQEALIFAEKPQSMEEYDARRLQMKCTADESSYWEKNYRTVQKCWLIYKITLLVELIT
jgi:hypothetical protein